MDASHAPSLIDRLTAHPTVILHRAVKAHGGFGFDPARNELTSTKPALCRWIADRADASLIADHADKQAAEPSALPAMAKAAKPAVTVKQPDASALANFAQALALLAPQQQIDAEQVREIVAEQLEAAIAAMPPKVIEIRTATTTKQIDGRQHKQFPQLLATIGARTVGGACLNIWLAGGAGAGKTTAAHQAADGLGMKFYTNGAIGTKYELTGFIDAQGKLVRTPFRDAWEHGGVYLFDEVDASVPAAVTAFNSALANGLMAFPDGMVPRHPDTVIIAAANTCGEGATAKHNGRFKQDAAFLDRFVFIIWQTDEALELAVSGNEEWTRKVQAMRAKAAKAGADALISPRASVYGAALLAAGLDAATVEAMVIQKGMSADQMRAIK